MSLWNDWNVDDIFSSACVRVTRFVPVLAWISSRPVLGRSILLQSIA